MNPAKIALDIKTFFLRQTQKLIKIIKFSKNLNPPFNAWVEICD